MTGTPIAAGHECGEVEGVKYTASNGSTNICDGENGKTGFTEHLPAGKTETGVWAYGNLGGKETLQEPISFPIPLGSGATIEPIAEGEEHFAEHCPGSAEHPKADAGFFCVYIGEREGSGAEFSFKDAGNGHNGETGETGVDLVLINVEGKGFGTWAVTEKE